jgi:uncharacterized membrane protein YdjX (TVP38/TMEM64 family)
MAEDAVIEASSLTALQLLTYTRGILVKVSSMMRVIGITLLAAAIGAMLLLLPVKSYLYEFLEWVRHMGPWGPLLVAAVYILGTVLLVPGSLLGIGAGFVLGVVQGTITVSIASTLGASAAFLLGRTLAREWVQERIARNPKFRAIDEAVRRQGFKIVFLLRLSPLFPFEILNYGLGLTDISFRDYVLASWIGMLPGTVMYVYLGSTLESLADLAVGRPHGGVGEKVLFGLGLATTIAVTVLVTRLARRALKDTIAIQQEEPPGETIHDAKA